MLRSMNICILDSIWCIYHFQWQNMKRKGRNKELKVSIKNFFPKFRVKLVNRITKKKTWQKKSESENHAKKPATRERFYYLATTIRKHNVMLSRSFSPWSRNARFPISSEFFASFFPLGQQKIGNWGRRTYLFFLLVFFFHLFVSAVQRLFAIGAKDPLYCCCFQGFSTWDWPNSWLNQTLWILYDRGHKQ